MIHEASQLNHLELPIAPNGNPYTIKSLSFEQQQIASVILKKVHEWMTCKDLSEFQPLRMTVFGETGTGKTTLIKALMSVI